MELQILLFLSFCIIGSYGSPKTCCMEVRACYDVREPQYGNTLPECFMPKFILYTKNNQKGEVITKGKIPASFNNEYMTVIMIHGLNDSPTKGNKWMMVSMQKIFQLRTYRPKGYNVIHVDWSAQASKPLLKYNQAVSNIRVGADAVSDLTKALINHGLPRKNTYCVGHSLGAHMCGLAGTALAKTKERFWRITGLDPAGIIISRYKPEWRLSKEDADFVDVIHTNGDGFLSVGMMTPMGHIDFYPNGGKHQPGCFVKLPFKIPNPMDILLGKRKKRNVDAGGEQMDESDDKLNDVERRIKALLWLYERQGGQNISEKHEGNSMSDTKNIHHPSENQDQDMSKRHEEDSMNDDDKLDVEGQSQSRTLDLYSRVMAGEETAEEALARIEKGAIGDIGCSHTRAVLFYIESIRSVHLMTVQNMHCFITNKCTDYKNVPGSCGISCGSPCPRMGFYANIFYRPGIYTVRTNAQSPYCLQLKPAPPKSSSSSSK